MGEKVYMKGYKGYSKGLICKEKQYAENTVFEEDEAVICQSGMHFCENPFDVLDYYPIIDENGEFNEFTDVEALDEVYTGDNRKYCTKKLKIGAKIGLKDFLKIGAEFIVEKTKKETEKGLKNNVVGGNYAKLVGGNYAQLVGGNYAKLVGGNYAQLVGGDNAKLVGGNYAKLVGGYNAKLVGGYNAKLVGGNYAQLVGGDNAKLVGGNYAQLVGGDNAKLVGGYNAKLVGGDNAKLVGGDDAVLVGDNGSKAKGRKGSVILLIERNLKGEIINYKATRVDGEKIKTDTWYSLVGGELKEANE